MSKSRKIYWVKMMVDFYSDLRVKKMLSDGDYKGVVIYHKLILLSAKTDCEIHYRGLYDTFEQEISAEISETSEDIERVLEYLVKVELVIPIETKSYQIVEEHHMVGSETDSAARQRKHRNKSVDEVIEDAEDYIPF